MQTIWTVGAGGVLMLNGSTAPLIKGVVYSPTPIGGNYEFEPHGDFYIGGEGEASYFQWAPWWQPDIDDMARAGVNSIRTYSWFMWMPTPANMTAAKTGNLPEIERDHTKFLDYCQSKGISVLIGVGWNPVDFPLKAVNRNNGFQEFYIENCRALAKQYGNHPAVMGLVLGNEVDNAATFADDQYSHYLAIMNGCADAAAGAGFAGKKIILPALHDNPFAYGNEDSDGTPVLRKHLQKDLSKSFTATGINTYRGPTPSLAQQYKEFLIDGQKIERPLLITEWGSPYSMRIGGQGAEISGETVQTHANWVRDCWKYFSDSASFPFLAGGYYFEWTDEWWKAPEISHGNQRGHHNFNPDSSRNDAFPGRYNDEAWYGVMGVAVSNGRDPMVYWDQGANGPVAPDKRVPRNTYKVLQEIFKVSSVHAA
ncbi:MAG TPA: hypothetical protein VKU19_08400 [Bryobacteraceae bacterium]|nr:hypothetical protein [Bryobacteraceae bacterium]